MLDPPWRRPLVTAEDLAKVRQPPSAQELKQLYEAVDKVRDAGLQPDASDSPASRDFRSMFAKRREIAATVPRVSNERLLAYLRGEVEPHDIPEVAATIKDALAFVSLPKFDEEEPVA